MTGGLTATESSRRRLEWAVVAGFGAVVLLDGAIAAGLSWATLGPLPERTLQGVVAVLVALLLCLRAALAGPRYGVAALVALPLAVLYGFTAQILPWDQFSFWLAQSTLEALLVVPVLGRLASDLLFGGVTLSARTLELARTYHYGVAVLFAGWIVGYLGVRGYGLVGTEARNERRTDTE